MMFKIKSIKALLSLLFIFIAIIPLIIFCIIIYFQRVRIIKKNQFIKLISIRDLKVNEINNWLERIDDDIKTITGDYEVRKIKKTFDKNPDVKQKHLEDIYNILNNYLTFHMDYKNFIFINVNDGKVNISVDKSLIDINVKDEMFFTEPLRTEGIYISDILFTRYTKGPVMIFSLPVYDLENPKEIVSVMACFIDLDNSIYRLLLNRTGMGNTGETLIVNDMVMALNDLRWHHNAPLRLKINAKPAVRAANGQTGIVETEDYRGVKVLAAYTYIQKTGWGFVAKQDLSEVYSPIKGLVIGLIIIFLIISLCIIVIVYFITTVITGPIIKITNISQKISSGSLDLRSPDFIINRSDEIGLLGKTINKMADSLLNQIDLQSSNKKIINSVIDSKSVIDFGEKILKKLLELTDSAFGVFYVLNNNEEYENIFSIGLDRKNIMKFNKKSFEGEIGKSLFTKKIDHIKNISENTKFIFKTTVGNLIPKELIIIPILESNECGAFITIGSISKYTELVLNIVEEISFLINTVYSNIKSNEERKKLTDELQTKHTDLISKKNELEQQSFELKHLSDELKEHNIELKFKSEQIEQANKLKTEFLSNMSHELRTPLNSVIALSDLFIQKSKETLSDKEKSYIEIINRNGKLLLSLINSILDLSKIEAGKMELKISIISLNTLVDSIVSSIDAIANKKGIKIIQKIDSSFPKIKSDEKKVFQILQNIISNAVKFTEKGDVSISGEKIDEHVYIYIKDTGIGIPEDKIDYIFEEFRQVDGSTTRKYEGTGLGLAIACKSAKLIGGKITVDSKVNQGSIFTIKFPAAYNFNDENLMIKKTLKNNKELTLNKIINKRSKKSKQRILLVEDNESAILQIKDLLENEKYIVDVVRNGIDAVEYVLHKIPDGIILDLMIPGIDGFEVLENIRNTEKTYNIPVLIMTAKDLTTDDLNRLSNNNIQQLVQKGDIDSQKLLFKISLLMGSKPAVSKKVKSYSTKTDNKNKVSIMIIEDNPDNMFSIKAALEDKYDIIESENGKKALTLLNKIKPDLIFMDILLPKMDGFELLKKLRNIDKLSDTPVIALTALSMKGDKEKILNSGFDDYIAKPIDIMLLNDVIRKYLNK